LTKLPVHKALAKTAKPYQISEKSKWLGFPTLKVVTAIGA
jgi:hypothetical protein